jgi:3-hydroxyisobutyrate dehydrogenase-like beta-hydroxyacid dehydrogenase
MAHPPVSVLGLGAMGGALAAALVSAGHRTTVWNRTSGKIDSLAARGAIPASSAAAAAAASPLVLLCVTDYRAADAVLHAAGEAVAGRVLVNLGTGTPDDASGMSTRAARLGTAYLDGVVQAGPAQVGTPAATMLYSGARESFDDHEVTLGHLGTATYVGADPGQACVYDLALLGLWYEAELAYFNALTLVGAPDTDPEPFVPFVRRQLGHVVDALPEVAKEARERRYPAGPASLVEHARVLDQLMEVRSGAGMDTTHLGAVRDAVRRLIDNGAGADGFTRLVEEVRPQGRA